MKNMKPLFTLFFLATTALAFAQNSLDYGHLITTWTQGKIDPNGTVIQADASRGGSYQLTLNQDASASFANPFTCGSGYERQGSWNLNEKDGTLTLTFSKRVGYMNAPGTAAINKIENYKIMKLTSSELILVLTHNGTDKILPFIQGLH
ncbi:hypothetical protein CNR22_18720 [Sphingobacteriaceae bacterium]|nr:hypothetical protein CNR22_18720 [Sphingobacteriaceae bacterium]